MDDALTGWINGFAGQHAWLDAVMRNDTHFGVPLMILFVVLLWWPKSGRQKIRHVCVSSGLAFLLGQAINQVVILIVHRPRPYDAGLTRLIVERSTDWSFPSDHATAAAAIACAFLLHGRRLDGIGLAIFAVVVGISRVFVGTHYVGDVLGGFATGLAAAWLVKEVYHRGTRLDRAITNIL